jgi:hypothetical protein
VSQTTPSHTKMTPYPSSGRIECRSRRGPLTSSLSFNSSTPRFVISPRDLNCTNPCNRGYAVTCLKAQNSVGMERQRAIQGVLFYVVEHRFCNEHIKTFTMTIKQSWDVVMSCFSRCTMRGSDELCSNIVALGSYNILPNLLQWQSGYLMMACTRLWGATCCMPITAIR